MFIKPNKIYQPGFLPYSNLMLKHAGWCLTNKIAVSLRFAKPREFFVEISIKGSVHKDPKERCYTGEEALLKMYEYYKYYYEKYNNQK
tara:strand:- start:5314 stop:5577 length:264 start_codon:yes stop_codon:yes gene_type:complete